jgi:hypothetical protein
MMQNNPLGNCNAGAGLLKSIRTSKKRAPVKPSIVHFYMGHQDYKEKVMAVYREEMKRDHPGEKNPRFNIAKHNAIAGRLFRSESKGTRKQLQKELKTSHAQNVETHKAAVAGEEPTTAEEIREYVAKFLLLL